MCVGATQLLGSWSQVGHVVCRLLLLVWQVEVGPFVVESASGAFVLKEVWEHLRVCNIFIDFAALPMLPSNCLLASV